MTSFRRAAAFGDGRNAAFLYPLQGLFKGAAICCARRHVPPPAMTFVNKDSQNKPSRTKLQSRAQTQTAERILTKEFKSGGEPHCNKREKAFSGRRKWRE
ncbi:hypothetical protein [uncultured Martelella sp.]|uniref:hypothetical protein n=1 Tax=uncultured Martelella sp. TaxID=392331 RepID=UPI0029C76809|nr:hypothetical protein [uncultured Martelella sp.]